MSAPGTSPYPDKLDVGCGVSPLPGFVGVDRHSAADVVHDLDRFPWPFENNSFSHIVCKHSLGHLDNLVRVMEELHRIGRQGAIIEIVSPHFSSDNYFTDVTHKHPFGYRSLDYFCVNRPCMYRYSEIAKFKMVDVRISFVQAKTFGSKKARPNPMRWIGLEWAINQVPRLYEHFLAFIFRANEVYFCLEVIK